VQTLGQDVHDRLQGQLALVVLSEGSRPERDATRRLLTHHALLPRVVQRLCCKQTSSVLAHEHITDVLEALVIELIFGFVVFVQEIV